MSENVRPLGNSRSATNHDNNCIIGDGSGLRINKDENLGLLGQSDPRVNRRNLMKLAGAAAAPLLTGCTQLYNRGKAQDDEGTIRVTPSDGLIDDSLKVLLSDFEPNEEITIRAHTTDTLGQTWLSFGRFTTSGNGTLSLTQQAPISGTYETVDPMGLLWSMQVPDEPTRSFTVDELYNVQVSVQRNSTTVASTMIKRRFIAPGVVEHPVNEDGLVGVFFEPPGSGPHPAVLALHGTEGQVPWLMGAMLASRGYATLALQYFDPTGKTGLPTSLVEIPLEYFERAINWVLDRPSVTGDQVGVVGPSIGGELTLLLGATLSRIGVVVGYVPSSLVWEGPGGERPMWTYNGKSIPFVPIKVNRDIAPSLSGAAAAGVRGRPVRVAELFHPSFDDLDAESVKAGIIPVEEIDGPVLLISGRDDGIWPSTTFSEIAIRRLRSYDHPYPYHPSSVKQLNRKPTPTCDGRNEERVNGRTLLEGGSVAADFAVSVRDDRRPRARARGRSP